MFEQEVFYLLVAGFVCASGAYAAQLYLMGAWREPAARRPFLWQFIWQAGAFVLLLTLLFPYRFRVDVTASVSNSFTVCLCGLLWAVSLLCAARGFRAMLGQRAEPTGMK